MSCFYYTIYFDLLKNIRRNSSRYFIINIPNRRELRQIAFNRSPDIDSEGFMNSYETCTRKPYFFLLIDTTLASDNPLRFRKNLLERT